MDTDNELMQFDMLATKHLAAYNAHATIFEGRNPRPQLQKVQRDLVSMIIILALALVMIAAVIVSGSRTVNEFGGDTVGLKTLIGLTAFVMVEGGIMAYAFFRARRTISKKRVEETVKWATAGLAFTVIVGLGANVDATLREHSVMLPDTVRLGLNLLVAVSAPALGFISSDVLAIELMALDFKRADALKEYNKALEKWQAALNTEWKNQQKNWGVKIRVEQPAPAQLPGEISSNLIKFNQNSRRNKPSPRLQKALDYLGAHPEDLTTAPRELELKITGVSYGTIHKAQVMLRDENMVDNGE